MSISGLMISPRRMPDACGPLGLDVRCEENNLDPEEDELRDNFFE